MNILITGGNGYLATALKRMTSSEITVVTRQDLDLRSSVEVNRFFSDKYFDVVIHTAIDGGSRLRVDTMSIMDNNLRMYYNILDNQHKFDRFISIGSGAELYQINTAYGLSKHVIRQSMLENSICYNIRVFAVFDENELPTRFIKSNINRYIKKEPILIHQNKQMDFFYMDDFINVMEYYITEKTPPKEFNCTYDYSYSLLDVANKINMLSDYKVSIDIEKPEMGVKFSGEPNNIKFNYVGLDEGIQRVYNKLCKI
jgi:nucleoside-diphosphate-sugar epimerase